MDVGRRALLLEAALFLLLARLALVFIPFRLLAKHLGTFVAPSVARASLSHCVHQGEEVQLAQEISWAVAAATRNAPFKALCLPQAIAAREMLARRGVTSVLHFGAAKSQEKMFEAHAWLDAAGVEVTGYPTACEFTEIACFV